MQTEESDSKENKKDMTRKPYEGEHAHLRLRHCKLAPEKRKR